MEISLRPWERLRLGQILLEAPGDRRSQFIQFDLAEKMKFDKDESSRYFFTMSNGRIYENEAETKDVPSLIINLDANEEDILKQIFRDWKGLSPADVRWGRPLENSLYANSAVKKNPKTSK